MKTVTPAFRRHVWCSVISHTLITGVFILVWYPFDKSSFPLLGFATYACLAVLLQILIPKSQRKGMQKIKKGELDEAIILFEKSYAFFKRYYLFDKYRYFFLLSSSTNSYKEVALFNILFCYAQLHDSEKTHEYYEKILKEYPKSNLTKVALDLVDSGNKKPEREV